MFHNTIHKYKVSKIKYITMDFKKLLSVLLILFFVSNSFAQIESKGIPYIKNYSRADYDGNNSVFSSIQDDRGIMYFANHTYILEFDGKTWNKINLPGNPQINSLSKDNSGIIYVGAHGEFGFLEATEDGSIKYKSLVDKIPETKNKFTKVDFVIKGLEGEMIFLTPLILYIYKNDTISTIDVSKPENVFIRPYKIKNRLFFQEKGLGILEYKKGETKLLPRTEMFSNKWVVTMFPAENNKMFIPTWQDSIYKYSDNEIESFVKSPLLKILYSSFVYNSKYFLAGLYGNGMVITDNKLNILKHFSTKNGLQNNTVYNVYADKDKNIWLGTNDGISVIFPNLPYTVFSGNSNLTEAVYTSILFNNRLFVGSTNGLFYKNFSEQNSIEGEKFELLDSLKLNVYVWKVDTANNTLLCASSRGLFEISENKANPIGPGTSVKNFIKLKNKPHFLFTITGHGLMLFEYINSKWVFKHTIKNFKGDYRHIAEDNDGLLWVSDKSKGIIRLKLNSKMDSVVEERLFTESDGLPSAHNNYVYKVDDKIVFTTEKGIYSYNNSNQEFFKNEKFAKIFNNNISITNLHQAENGNIWFKEELDDPKLKNKKHWELGLIKKIDGEYKVIKTPFYKVKNRINSIKQISDNELVIGTEAGFVLYDINSKKQFEEPFLALIRKVEFQKNDSILFGGAFINDSGEIVLLQNPKRIPKIPYEFNDLRFNFASVFYEEPEKTQYKFILKGYDTEWSDWKFKTDKEYSNIDPGTYTLIVRAKNLYDVESKVAEYTFEVLPPWYKTIGAYLGYFILFILFIYGIIQLSVYQLKKQRENLKRIVEERTKEIQIQKEEIEAKNETLSEANEEISQKNKSITASINYAKRIQEAMLPVRENIIKHLPESFILFKPRDIVSGDFYWYAERDNKIIYTAVDCTGHGVPGALMSMIGSEILNTIIHNDITKADIILEKMNEAVVKILKQETEGFSQDGMDMTLCVIDKENKTVEYAGAKNPLIIINDGQLTQIKASRYGIGGYQAEAKEFESHLIKYESPTWFYMFTDGFQDQFGGPRDRKYMIKRMKDLLLNIHYKPMLEQHDILKKEIEDWMENTPQTDDILLTCFKL